MPGSRSEKRGTEIDWPFFFGKTGPHTNGVPDTG